MDGAAERPRSTRPGFVLVADSPLTIWYGDFAGSFALITHRAVFLTEGPKDLWEATSNRARHLGFAPATRGTGPPISRKIFFSRQSFYRGPDPPTFKGGLGATNHRVGICLPPRTTRAADATVGGDPRKRGQGPQADTTMNFGARFGFRRRRLLVSSAGVRVGGAPRPAGPAGVSEISGRRAGKGVTSAASRDSQGACRAPRIPALAPVFAFISPKPL